MSYPTRYSHFFNMNKEQIKSESEVVKDHDQDNYEAALKVVERKQKEVHHTQTHAIFEMVSELASRGKKEIPKMSYWRAGLVLVLFWCSMAGVGKVSSGRFFWQPSNEEWLWSSHDMLIAIVEDDPKFLIQNDGWAWNRFQEIATTARINGFVQVVNDGEHPNLQRWYMQDQLTQSESDLKDGVAGN